jgi:GH24 family phage-related lysozyme (muramidase)
LGWRLRYSDDYRDVPCSDVLMPQTPEHAPADTFDRYLRILSVRPELADAGFLASMASNFAALTAHPDNIDLSAGERERAIQMYALLGRLVGDLDTNKPPDHQENIRRFLLHLSWHESDCLRTRAQYDDGPARSLFQFECLRARDELNWLDTKKQLSLLTQSAGATESQLRQAIGSLPNASKFPVDNLITQLMEGNDLFAARLARLAFRGIPAPVPNDNAGHADYWYRHWKRTGGDPDELKRTFARGATRVDQLLGLTSSGSFYLIHTDALRERESLNARATEAGHGLSSVRPDADGVSERAITLIEHQESGGYDYYSRFATHPYWPGVSSGVTLGFGFDLGYRTQPELHERFQALGEQNLARLDKAVGTHAGQGAAAKVRINAWIAEYADITINWALAADVLRTFDIPRYTNLTQATFKTTGLNADQLGALVSLVFNRGTRTEGERREEMAAIKRALAQDKPEEVPALIRAMKRLWPDVPSLQRRREDEARLFEG